MGEPEHGTADGTVRRPEAAQAALRDHFLGWQCRLRQMAVRQAGGRPTSGMRPEVRLAEADTPLGAITTLIVRREPREATAQFRHLVRKTQDPAERHDAALETLAAAYYQRPRERRSCPGLKFDAARKREADACMSAYPCEIGRGSERVRSALQLREDILDGLDRTRPILFVQVHANA